MLSVMPDTCWLAGMVANTGPQQLCSVSVIELDGPPPLAARRIGPASRLRIVAGGDCRLEVCRCLRPMDAADKPTWRASRRRAGRHWSSPGAGGHDDSRPIGTVSASAGLPATLDGTEVVEALQPLAAGRQVWLVTRRADVGPGVVSISAQCEIQWLPGALGHV